MERYLIIQTAFPGDAVLTLPLLQELKRTNPGSIIDVAAIPSTQEIFSRSRSVDNVFILDKKNKHKSITAAIKFALKLRTNKYSVCISPHRSFRSTLIAVFCGAVKTTGFNTASFSFLYDNTIKYRRDWHEVKRNLSFIKEYEADKWKIKPELDLTELDKKISLPADNFITIAPGSVWNTKRYPVEYYSEIIEYYSERDYSFVIIGSNNELDICRKLNTLSGEKGLNLAGKTNLIEAADIIKKSELLICNDSAPAHIAQAVGTPVVMLYCSTIPGFGFHPYVSNSRYLSFNDLSCKPCGIHGHQKCPLNTFDCGYNLKPKEVIQEINSLMNWV